MTEPISHATASREIGPVQSLSQASSAAKPGGGSGNGPAQRRTPTHVLKLRHYVKEMQGMLLDASA